MWWKLEKSFFKLNSDIFICSANVPPQNSSTEIRIDIDHYDHLQNDIYKFLNQGKVLLCGDFNARTGNLDDLIFDDRFTNIENFTPINVPKRTSRDTQVNAYGKSLNELCIGNNLISLNGRTKGDLIGLFTCNTYNGASVVDYVIVSQDLFPFVQSFWVHNPTELTHHSCLSVVMRIETP